MTFTLLHIFFIAGIITIIFSLLFFGRDTGIYDILITVGLIVSTITYLIILFKKDNTKNKLIWTLIVIASIGLQWLTEPILINKSYSLFVSHNQNRLTKLNSLILTKKNDLFFVPSSDNWTSKELSINEANKIRSLLKGTNISLIQKDTQKIFYRTFGMLDISHGIYYFYGKGKPDIRFKQIFENWYY